MSEAPYMPELVTARLLLRQLRLEDVEAIYAYASDPEVARYTTWYPHQSLGDASTFLEDVVNRYQAKEPADWGLVLASSNQLIGTCGFTYIKTAHSRAEVGYAMSRLHWGHGLMTEALDAVLSYGFTALGLNRIEARTVVDNRMSQRVLEKCHMQYEGVLRQQMRIKGQYWDMKMYSILHDDYVGLGISG